MRKLLLLTFICAYFGLDAYAQLPDTKQPNMETESIFPKGEKGPETNFTGNAWNYGIVTADGMYNMVAGNVYFEPGARTNWHSHPGGQILIITAGEGFHQIRGQAKQLIKKGDVVKCPPNVEHWHGAGASSGMQQLYIVPNASKGIVKWLNKVTEEEYTAK